MSNPVSKEVSYHYLIMIGVNYLADLSIRSGYAKISTFRDGAVAFHSDPTDSKHEREIAKRISDTVIHLNNIGFKDVKVIKSQRVEIIDVNDCEVEFVNIDNELKLRHVNHNKA